MLTVSRRRRVAVAIILLATSVLGDRVWYNSTGTYVIEDDYNNDNIYIVNGTRVYLENGVITAPNSTDDGDHAVVVKDSTFYGKSGAIHGGMGIGGKGITISTTKGTDNSPGTATFEAGMEVYGGDAYNEDAGRGIAVEILHNRTIVTFNGGKFNAGEGCKDDVCGENGVSVHVVRGKAIVKGGTFEGGFYNDRGDIEVHGCVVYNDNSQTIVGVLLDGSNIDVAYRQPTGQNIQPNITLSYSSCPESNQVTFTSALTAGITVTNPILWICLTFGLGFVVGVMLALQ